MSKVIVVGAGLSGATAARILAEAGYTVIVMDKRETIGGNAFDYIDKNGIMVQPYGPHIFHTNDKEVFDFLSRFTEWNKYEHRVLANIKGKLVPVPFNLTSLKETFSADKAQRIKEVLTEEVGIGEQIPILALTKHENPEIRAFAQYVYYNIFYYYTKKQWGFKPEECGDIIMTRVPVYVSYEDRYFTDEYQYMPRNGFTEMITKILAHPSIQLKLGTDANKVLTLQDGEIYLQGKKFRGQVVYTGCIDELFDYRFGVLPYRSLKFKFRTKKYTSYQKAAVINYTTHARYTRVTEFSKFTCEPKANTVIAKEYPKKFKKGKNIPYYPIPTQANHIFYARYVELAKKYDKLYLLGRLANYKYIDMDVAVKNAIELANQIIDG